MLFERVVDCVFVITDQESTDQGVDEKMSQEAEGFIADAPKLAPFNPSSADVIRQACDLLAKTGGIGKEDVVFELGCGDARLLCALAQKFGCRGVGVEYDARFVQRAQQEIEHYKVSHLVEVRHADVTKIKDIDQATVVFMYLNVQDDRDLQKLVGDAYSNGARILSSMFSLKYLGDFNDAVVCDGITRLYYYRKPVDAEDEDADLASPEASGNGQDALQNVQGGDEGEKSELLKKLEWFFDPLRNPYIIKVFNGAMISLFLLLIFLVYNGLGNIHIYNIVLLSMCLFCAVNWFIREYRAAVEKETQEKEEAKNGEQLSGLSADKPAEAKKAD